MKAKPWQIGLIVVGLVVGAGSAAWFFFGGDQVRLDRQYYLIDVETGQIFEVDSTRYRLVLPAQHPETGKVSLIGVHKDETGRWYVPRRDLGSVSQLDKGVEVKAVDRDGELVNPPGAPVRYEKR